MELTILMPCLNEARTVGQCVAAATEFLRRNSIDGEVLVADNGSMDASAAIAEAEGARVVRVAQAGYGAAILGGIDSSAGKYIIMADADMSYDFSHLDGFLEQLRSGVDLVMGNRFRGGIEDGAMPFLHQYLGNPVLSFVGRLFFRVKIGDFHCGLRGFSRESILSLRLMTPGMEFASEMVAKAALSGLRIAEVPTTLRPDGRGRPSHLRTWRDGWRHLRFLLLFCPRWLFLYPGIFLSVLGLTGFALLSQASLSVINIGLDIHSLLYMSAATILGMQLVQLAFLTKWIGVLSGIVPSPRWLMATKSWLSLEAGIVVGMLLVLMGLAWSIRLVFDWQAADFGALEPREVMRSAIPSVTMMIVGMQGVAGALFAGALHACWRSIPSRL